LYEQRRIGAHRHANWWQVVRLAAARWREMARYSREQLATLRGSLADGRVASTYLAQILDPFHAVR